MPKHKSTANFPCVTCGRLIVGWSGYCRECQISAKKRKKSFKLFRRLLPVGVQIGKLTVAGWPFHRLSRSNRLEWFVPVLCACGVRKEVMCNNLLKPGHCRSCGCLARKLTSRRTRTHGATNTHIYEAWTNMLTRCYNPKAEKFPRYGGRGILVCDEWRHDFAAFLKWMTENDWKRGLQIDRIDNDGPYSPANCRLVTPKQNNHNRSAMRLLTAFGETKKIQEWLEDERCTVLYTTLLGRLKREWTPEDALTKPLDPRGFRKGKAAQ